MSTKNNPRERSQLEKDLISLANDNNIDSVTFDYEVDVPNEYYIFGSSSTPPIERHTFSVLIEDASLVIERSAKYRNKLFTY